jgi:hypothetical protein
MSYTYDDKCNNSVGIELSSGGRNRPVPGERLQKRKEKIEPFFLDY